MKYNKDKREVNQACANELEGEITLQLEQRAANAPVVALDFFSVTAQLVLVTESRAIQITKLALLQKRLMAEGLKLYHKQYPFPFGIISKCARDSSFVLISIELNKQKKIRSNRHVLNSLPFYGPTRIQKKHDRSKLYFTRRLFIIQFDNQKKKIFPLRSDMHWFPNSKHERDRSTIFYFFHAMLGRQCNGLAATHLPLSPLLPELDDEGEPTAVLERRRRLLRGRPLRHRGHAAGRRRGGRRRHRH